MNNGYEIRVSPLPTGIGNGDLYSAVAWTGKHAAVNRLGKPQDTPLLAA